MKKLIFTPLLIASGLLLVGCNQTNQNSVKDYYIVDCQYNLESKQGLYLSQVVMKDATISAPKDPEVEDYVFSKWYLDEACTREYLRWGLQLDSDLTLYAKWESFESQPLETKISHFQAKLASMGENASKVVQETKATIGYPGVISGEDGVFGVEDRYIYSRYNNNITVKDYFSYEAGEDDASQYGSEKFYIKDGKFYDEYDDFEDDTQDESSSSAYTAGKENSYLSIDFQNLYKECENNILYYASSSAYDEETFSYLFTGNFTKLNPDLVNYAYQEAYFVANYSDSAGAYISKQYTYEFGLNFRDGIITSANVSTTFMMYLGDEIYQYVFEDSTYDFYYNNGTFPDYNAN